MKKTIAVTFAVTMVALAGCKDKPEPVTDPVTMVQPAPEVQTVYNNEETFTGVTDGSKTVEETATATVEETSATE